MRRFGILAAVFGFAVLGLAGCNRNEASGSGGAAPAPKQSLKVGIVFDSGGRGDKSFNDSAYAGIERAKKEFGIAAAEIETKDANDYETNLTAMAERGNDLVISVGINTASALTKVAPKFPNTKFAIIDGTVEAPNIRSLTFAEHQGSFLVGYVAGLMTKTNKVGFVGGMEIDLIKKFQVGFEAGAMTANPNVQVLPAKYTGNWDNQDVAKSSASVLYNDGADIVFAAAGRAGLGVIRAAQERKQFAIGVDSDQDYLAEGTVLTSMIKRVDESVFQTIKDVIEGKFTAGTKVYDLAADGVGVSPMTYTKDLFGEANKIKLDQIIQEIKSGKINVPSTPAELTQFKASNTKPKN